MLNPYVGSRPPKSPTCRSVVLNPIPTFQCRDRTDSNEEGKEGSISPEQRSRELSTVSCSGRPLIDDDLPVEETVDETVIVDRSNFSFNSMHRKFSTIFKSSEQEIIDGEVVARRSRKDEVEAVGGHSPSGSSEEPRNHKDVVLFFEEGQEVEQEKKKIWTKWAILKTLVIVVIMVSATLIFGIVQTQHEKHRPHGAEYHSAIDGQSLTVSLENSETRHHFVQVDFFVDRPPSNVSVELQLQSFTEAGGWVIEGEPWNITVRHRHTEEYFSTSKRLVGPTADQTHPLRLLFTTSNASEPLTFGLKALPLGSVASYEVLIAGIILLLVYGLIIFEFIPRVLTAMLGALFTLITYSIIHERPSLEYAVTWIDYETVILLFGMMMMVQILSSTGAFEKVTLYGLVLSKGDPWRLIWLLGVGVAVVSAFLDNVTCMLLLTPVCIRLCQTCGLKPQPVLIATAIMSNIGGAATGVGDPPNIIIINYAGVIANKIGFAEFSLHCTIAALFAGVVAIAQLRLMYSKFIREARQSQNSVRSRCQNTDLWEAVLTTPRTKEKLSNKRVIKASQEGGRLLYEGNSSCLKLSKSVPESVRNAMVVNLARLEDKLESSSPTTFEALDDKPFDIEELKKQYIIRDKYLLWNCIIILTLVVLLFFFGSVLHLHLNLPWVALLGFMTLLLLSDIHDLETMLEHIEWGTLLFFAALFILMHGLEKLGLIKYIGDRVVDMISGVSEDNRLTVAIVLLLWVSGLASAFIDNIPYTAAMCPVIVQMADDLNLPLRPLVWTLAMGACLGGNGTLIGASANVVTAGLAQMQGYPISFVEFFKVGFPIMIGSMVITTAVLLACHPGLGWNT